MRWYHSHHDPESIVLYQPGLRVLISADALWENGFGVVFPELEDRTLFSKSATPSIVWDSCGSPG